MDCCAFGLMRIMLLCAAQIGAFAQHAPECFPGGHRTLRNPHRSVDFDSTEIQNTAIQDLICDHSLSPGWYRFRINNTPAEMPTACVEMNRCGTQAPVWLSLKDASLPRPGEVRQLSACATWQFFHGSTKDCCLFRIAITVRNCGDFLLYYLQPTQGCMGYCAKDVAHALCPPGEVDVNGRCQAAVPSLLSRPVITAELIGYSVHLRCSFTPPPWTQRLGYHVVWARRVGHSMKAEIRQESTLETTSLVEMDGVHFRLGETFSCSVSTFAANSSHSRSTARDSETFYAGLKFAPDSLHIAENGEDHEVTVHSTVPIACYNQDLDQRCRLPLALNVHDPDGLGHEAANVALSACQVALQPTACGNGSCGRATFFVTAVTDFTRDGNRPSMIGALPVHLVPRLWRNYVPAPLKVRVQDVPTSMCYSLTDPHVVTLDGRRYENHQTGTFVLYRSLAREFEVHSRQWDCGSRHYAVACSCGVAARDGSEVAILDMCNGQPQETKPRLTLKNLEEGDGNGNRVRVLETHQGKKVTLIFPSGAFVRADVSDWGMSLSVRAPSVDYGNTRGLCGTFDRNVNNDFLGSDGRSYGTDNLLHFIEDWRLAPGESLFDTAPPKAKQVVRRPFCQCRTGYSTHRHADRGTKNLFPPSTESSCITYDDVDDTSVFPSIDTTREYIRSPEQELRILDMSAFSAPPLERTPEYDDDDDDDYDDDDDDDYDDDDELDSEFGRDFLSPGRSRRQALFEFKPVFSSQSLSQSDLENFAYFFPEDHLAEMRPEARPQWPTPGGLTQSKAVEVCHLALANSTVGWACRHLLGRRLDDAVELCILDLQLKDDLAWEAAMLPYLENECERRFLENRTQRALEVPGHAGPGEVVTALRCPNLCNGNGRCTERGCQCHPGHSFHDCSLAISRPVEVTDLENSGLCDLRVFDCRRVRVFGLGFIDSHNLSCYATRLKHVNGVWVPAEKQRTKATYLSSKALDCGVPPLSNTAIHTEDFPTDDKPYARWEIQVTNDGSQHSQAKVLTVYDGVCQVCDASQSGLCKSKERTCKIDGMCLAEGDSNPSSSCLLCDPDESTFTWSLNKANEPPVFHRPQDDLQTFEGENFVFQFAASDPEGSAILFQLEAGPPGAVLSPAGLLIWSVPPLPEEEEEAGRRERRSFRFTLSDECNAQSRVTVEVVVVPCGCHAGGTCVTDINFPAGSGKYLCVCPDRKHGDLCDLDVDECLSGPCAAGECINTAGGYRCECPSGRKGATCLEDIDECETKPCFPGIQCSNSFGSYSCGPCPKGMLGNGTTCSAVIRPVIVTPTSVLHTDVHKIADVLLHPPRIKTETFPKTLSGNSLQTRAEEAKKFPRTRPDGSQTQTDAWGNIPRISLGPTTAEANKSVAGIKQTVNDDLGKEIDPNSSQANTDTSKNASGITQNQIKSDPASKTAAKTSTGAQPPAGSGRSEVLNGSATCASRPCFPGVQCIDRRPPHVGYVCGRCPPGLYGNGRACMKNAKAASNHLPQQHSLSKPSRSSHNSSNNKVSQLHLPVIPARHGIKHLSSPVTRPNRGGAPHQASGREGRTGRREALAVASTDGPNTSVSHLHRTTNKAKSNAKADATASVTVSKFHGEVKGSKPRSKVTPPISQQPQLNHLMPTRVKPWTAPQPGRPLTAALTALSYSLSESEFSADGDEVDPGVPEPPPLVPGLTLTTPGRPAHSTSDSVHRASSSQPVARTSTSADRAATPCADRPCFPGVACEPATDGGFRCGRCPVGYIGDGQTCRAVCKHPCGRNMACAAPNTCRCKPGYTGNNCQTAICEPPCLNAGVCVAPDVCQCPRGFHGETCQEALCSSPCENGGVCAGRQSCSCPYGFVGPQCETMVCTRHCHHGGQCVAPDECKCPPGWSGPSCQTALCSPVCLNGGLCVRPNTCECPRGFYGARCQNAVCSPSCKNGGLCRRNNVCSCLQGYTGTRCQKSVCEPVCMNGGRCVGPDVCDCPSGWQGTRCDKPSCLQKCLNGGECVGPNVCHCAAGWEGVLCQIPHCEQKCLYGSRCVRPNVCACRRGSSASLCSRRLPITRG